MILLDILAAYLVLLGFSLVLTRSNFVLEAPLVIPRILNRIKVALNKRRARSIRGDIEVESQESTWRAGDDH